MRSSKLLAVSAIALCAAGLTACSSTATNDAPAATASSSSSAAAAVADTDGQYTDAQLQAFIAARRDIEPISQGFAELAPDARAQASTRIREIMDRNQVNPTTYDAIQRQIGTDQALAQRVTQMQVATVTDEKLRAFVAASREIQPLTANLATASEAEREQVSTQIGAILSRHNIDSNLYNAIAVEAQSNQALAARIAAVTQPSATPQGD